MVIKTNTANYGFTLEFSPSERARKFYEELGIKVAYQNPVLMAWEKQVAYPDKTVDGKLVKGVRPKGFKRKDIPFTEENAKRLEQLFAKWKLEVPKLAEDGTETDETEEIETGLEDVRDFEEYSGTAGFVPKFKAQKDLVTAYLFESDGTTPRKLKSGEARSLESFCLSREIELPTDPWEDDVAFLKAVKEWASSQD